ncbi:hypothetical protein VP01_2663g2 [Puccinia sorghi]|uniref:Uncharacterized protein n=1 Tax=Puccinia sorghi TaxID=27349 RepID=A0A0L6V5T2_9BASI|nr:hypothetical protein VP01_2663g2 [Puccinia sorghi]
MFYASFGASEGLQQGFLSIKSGHKINYKYLINLGNFGDIYIFVGHFYFILDFLCSQLKLQLVPCHHQVRPYVMVTGLTYSPQKNIQGFLILVEGLICFQNDIKPSCNQFTNDFLLNFRGYQLNLGPSSPKIRLKLCTTYHQHKTGISQVYDQFEKKTCMQVPLKHPWIHLKATQFHLSFSEHFNLFYVPMTSCCIFIKKYIMCQLLNIINWNTFLKNLTCGNFSCFSKFNYTTIEFLHKYICIKLGFYYNFNPAEISSHIKKWWPNGLWSFYKADSLSRDLNSSQCFLRPFSAISSDRMEWKQVGTLLRIHKIKKIRQHKIKEKKISMHFLRPTCRSRNCGDSSKKGHPFQFYLFINISYLVLILCCFISPLKLSLPFHEVFCVHLCPPQGCQHSSTLFLGMDGVSTGSQTFNWVFPFLFISFEVNQAKLLKFTHTEFSEEISEERNPRIYKFVRISDQRFQARRGKILRGKKGPRSKRWYGRPA